MPDSHTRGSGVRYRDHISPSLGARPLHARVRYQDHISPNTLSVPTQLGLHFRADHPVQLREGVAPGVVVPGDVQEAVGHSTTEQKAADHSHWDKEGQFVAIDPAGRRVREDLNTARAGNQGLRSGGEILCLRK